MSHEASTRNPGERADLALIKIKVLNDAKSDVNLPEIVGLGLCNRLEKDLLKPWRDR
jgi:hypothetical protein